MSEIFTEHSLDIIMVL